MNDCPVFQCQLITPACGDRQFIELVFRIQFYGDVLLAVQCASKQLVTFDGQVARKLQPGDVLQVRKSKKIARIIKVKGDSFYRILRIKVGGQNEEK